jgi:hypothetical protein
MAILSQFPKKAFGGGLNKFVKGGARKVKVTMSVFQKGGINTPGVVKYETIEELYADPNASAVVESGKAYVKGENGKYKRVNTIPGRLDLEKRTDLDPLKNEDPNLDYTEEYAYLENELMLNADARSSIFTNYQETINSDKKLSKEEKEALLAKKEPEVINDFLSLQKQNMALQAHGRKFTTPEWGNKNKPQLHLILIYNSKLQSDNNIDTAILKNAFFKEIESSRISKPFVWLIDIINEKSINLNNNSAVYYSISQFADLLYTSAGLINAPTPTMVNYSEKEKPCMYSTFGYSLMHFPTDKIKEYLSIHAKTQEFDYLVKDFDTKFEIIAIKDETTKFFRKNDFENIPQKISKKENAEDIYIPLAYSKIAKHY